MTINDDDAPSGGPGDNPFHDRQRGATVGRGAASVTLTAERVSGSTGLVQASAYTTKVRTAFAGTDFQATNGTVAGRTATRQQDFVIPIVGDTVEEANETFIATLSAPIGGATIGNPATATVTITDDDTSPVSPVSPTRRRFASRRARAIRHVSGCGSLGPNSPGHRTGAGFAVPFSTDSGFFYFFNPEQPRAPGEDGARLRYLRLDAYWFFYAAASNVGLEYEVARHAACVTRPTRASRQDSPGSATSTRSRPARERLADEVSRRRPPSGGAVRPAGARRRHAGGRAGRLHRGTRLDPHGGLGDALVRRLATPTMFGVASRGDRAGGSFGLALEGELDSVALRGRAPGRLQRHEGRGSEWRGGRSSAGGDARLGLPGDFTLSAGWVPPIDFDGVTPNLISVALARPIWTGERGRLGAQALLPRRQDRRRHQLSADGSRRRRRPGRESVRLRRGLGRHDVDHLVGCRAGLRLAGDADGRALRQRALAAVDAEFQVRALYQGSRTATAWSTTATTTPGRPASTGRRPRSSSSPASSFTRP